MTLVVDANVAIKWFVLQQGSAPLVTADKKLINRLASTQYASNVIHLSDWT
jgi:predicted nucleic acid-binding protein